ncbi:MAG: hypothetical protein AB1480_00140 [Nitrospirota bacterium]
MRKYLFMLLVFLFFIFTANQVVFSHDGEEFAISSGDAWMDNYTLVITDAKTINEAWDAVEEISRAGGHIGVVIPNQVMLGWVPQEKVKTLVGRSKIRNIYQKPISDSSRKAIVKRLSASSIEFGKIDENAKENAIQFFNEVVSGEYKLKKSQMQTQMKAAAVKPHMLPDSFEAPPVSYRNYMNNLLANGITEDTLQKAGIYAKQTPEGAISLSPGNSDYMVGRILFNAIFVESNGGIDPNTYTWTAADRTTIQNEIIAGLSWWANTAWTYTTYHTPISFATLFRYNANCLTSYEPISHPSSDDYLWINQIMANFGYGSGDQFARTTAFNTAQRTAYNTNWATVSFIGYNPSPASTTFTDGYFAYAYIRGPYSQLLFRNNGWGTSSYDIVNAHETGHLYGASDEYYQAGYGGCTSCAAATNNVLNGNCEYCNANSIDCMMKSNSSSLCGYTPGQLGWRNIQSMELKTYDTSGNYKYFFAPGESIQYKVYYCIAGPRYGSTTHAVRVRFRADYFSGALGSSSNVSDDTGWASAGTVTPPTSTGLSCYVTWWNRTVPAATYGTGSLSVQLELANIGRGSISDNFKFYVAEGADTTEPSTELSPETASPNEGPSTEPIEK